MRKLIRHPLAPAMTACAIFAVLGLVPPFSRDALNDHLVLPWLWQQHGWFWRNANLVFTAYPPLADIPYMLFANRPWDAAASVWHACGAALTLVFLWRALSNLHVPERCQAVVLLSWIAASAVVALCTWSYVDLWLCAAAAALTELLTRATWKHRDAALYGLICGAMALIKYNGVPLAGAAWMALAWRWRTHPRIWRWLAMAAGAAVAIGGWWYVWNRVSLGHAMYPVGAGEGGGLHWLRYRQWAYHESFAWALLAPIRQFFWGEVGQARLFDGMLHPLWLLGIWSAWRWRGSSRVSALFMVVLLYAVVALTTAVRARYWLPGLVFLMPLVALALTRWRRPGMRWLVAASFVPVVVSTILYIEALSPWQYWMHGRDAFLREHVSDYPLQRWVSRHAPEGARIYLVWTGGRAYYLKRDYRADFMLRGESWLNRIARIARPEQDYLMINHRLLHQALQGNAGWHAPFSCLRKEASFGDFALWLLCR